ncbi:YkvA family protein [Arenimonas daejeonensis]|uniref:YkvA family protein n=1 Tax=Arenimonas daejeonensis TaxID=370777 RepID=UPI0011BEBBF5|nr:YkvA family protein [Arenimonas daejeonensis]
MNARLKDDHLALRLPPESTDSRRRQVGLIALGENAVQNFNALLSQLDPNAPRVTADQLVTLARWLQEQPREQAVALLSERLARAEQLRRMLNDSDWDVGADTRERARMLISYLQEVNDLIPDDLPLVGHLDDALLVELSWAAFANDTWTMATTAGSAPSNGRAAARTSVAWPGKPPAWPTSRCASSVARCATANTSSRRCCRTGSASAEVSPTGRAAGLGNRDCQALSAPTLGVNCRSATRSPA